MQKINADFFSRFPVQSKDTKETQMNTMCLWQKWRKTRCLYWNHKEDLSLEDDCVLWGRLVFIPLIIQGHLWDEFHECHPGMCCMKALDRSFIWWPGIDQGIEDRVQFCADCVNTQSTPGAVPLLFWPWATEPWQRIHFDFAAVKGWLFLIIVDSHPKWLEVFPMATTTATATINVLRAVFARYGLPHKVISDNGPQFVSEEYQTFLRMNKIKLTLVPSYHPASNGLAERHAWTFKGMYKAYVDKRSVQQSSSYSVPLQENSDLHYR